MTGRYATSDRLALRDFELSDVEALHAIYGDERVTKFLSFQPRSEEQVRATIEGIIERRSAQPRTEYALAGILRSTGELVAMIRLATDDEGGVQVGFALHADHWGKGLGSELAEVGVDYAFRELGAARVWGARDSMNEASARTLHALGMEDRSSMTVSVERADGSRRDRDSPVAAIERDQWMLRQAERNAGPSCYDERSRNRNAELQRDDEMRFMGL